MKEIVGSCILFLVSAFCLFMSIRSFAEKGFLFNNAYIWASEQERKRLDKKPRYRQSAIVFLLLAIAFLVNALAVLFKEPLFFFAVGAVLVAALVYAIVSTVAIEKEQKRGKGTGK